MLLEIEWLRPFVRFIPLALCVAIAWLCHRNFAAEKLGGKDLGARGGARGLPSFEGSGSKFFVKGSSVEVALMIEGVVCHRVDGEKVLRRSGRLEPLHFTLASSDRLM